LRDHALVSQSASPDPNALFVDLSIDHFGSNSATFKNRYWINDTYYSSGGPVFLFDAGEGDASSYYEPFLLELDGESNVMQLAQKYHGLAILWEHRYYGQSLPFTINEFTTGAEWQYLTLDQALEDVVQFANNFTLPLGSAGAGKLSSSDALHPSKTPWIFLGASYPGIRAAVLRIRNPEVIFASWASSAPVEAQVNMASYYEAVERSLPRNCSADWVAVTKYVDDTLNGSNITLQEQVKFDLYQAHLSGPGGNTSLVGGVTPQTLSIDPMTAASYLLDPLTFFQSRGPASTIPFCDRLETRNFTQTASSQGLITTGGIDITFNSFIVAIAEVDYNAQVPTNIDMAAYYSWSWQFCSQFGFYQVADPNNQVSIVTSYLSLQAQQYDCNAMFNGSTYFPPSPNVTALNKYGGWKMSPSNVFLTNGELDPWRTLSVGSLESNSPQRNASSTVPACNTSPGYPSYFGLTYPGQVHGSDVFTSPLYPDALKQPFIDGLGLFGQALDTWLPCFGNVSASNNGHSSGGVSNLHISSSLLVMSLLFSLLLGHYALLVI